jgi:hypothetical protein
MTKDELAEIFEALESASQSGDKGALLRVIRVCAIYECPLPDWAARDFEIIFTVAEAGGIQSWDDEFGSPIPDGRRAGGLQTRSKRFAVWVGVRESQLPIDKAFQHVAGKLGMSTSTVRDLYYEVDRVVQRVGSCLP